ncbi:MAG: hypothetical protein R3F43_23245 [bacterium]
MMGARSATSTPRPTTPRPRSRRWGPWPASRRRPAGGGRHPAAPQARRGGGGARRAPCGPGGRRPHRRSSAWASRAGRWGCTRRPCATAWPTPSCCVALPALAELGAPTDALAAVDRLLADEHDPGARRAAGHAGRDLRARRRPAGARSARHDALALGPVDLAAARGLLDHLDEAPAADQVEILRRIRRQLTHERGPRPGPCSALGETLMRRGDPAGALEVFGTSWAWIPAACRPGRRWPTCTCAWPIPTTRRRSPTSSRR